ncbi:MAG: helix-turn-helix transcriptional regulator [Proteiniphilum sp.]|jgi:transcriptional regulator with XRE-family HTH domain|uniref:helix-turn-helix domain-containing protein n=1 Tax=Proteiniphilum sp. TaxID=1926877 RepID=UPI002B20460A|nr:helix-turn-helix transcriptional regulator [Proteiniphilum sp.]MEA5127368.1 helix-turn-helix transcriptional regulator [Proteiniphilum sp.]
MNNTENNKKSAHQGKNAKLFRETRGIKQEAIAIELEISQQAVSQLEKRQELDDETIAVYARVVGIDEYFIRNMVDDSLPEGSNYFYDQSSQISQHNTQTLNFNPLDKVMELCSEKDQLYERMLELEKEKSALLEQLLKEKK